MMEDCCAINCGFTEGLTAAVADDVSLAKNREVCRAWPCAVP